ncbi:MAG: hypothetical protein OXG33_09630 [Chloroflexi bacterium]|nr:hypothetical protein [Chloroflexota bacterium]
MTAGGVVAAVGDAVGEVVALDVPVTCGDGESGATAVVVGAGGGSGVGATTTMAVVAEPGPGVASPHAATVSMPMATGVTMRARLRIIGVASWEIDGSSGAHSF